MTEMNDLYGTAQILQRLAGPAGASNSEQQDIDDRALLLRGPASLCATTLLSVLERGLIGHESESANVSVIVAELLADLLSDLEVRKQLVQFIRSEATRSAVLGAYALGGDMSAGPMLAALVESREYLSWSDQELGLLVAALGTIGGREGSRAADLLFAESSLSCAVREELNIVRNGMDV